MGPKNKKKGKKIVATGDESTDQQTNRSSHIDQEEHDPDTQRDSQSEQNIKQDGEEQKVEEIEDNHINQHQNQQLEQSNTQVFAYESPPQKQEVKQDQIKESYTMVERVSQAESNFDEEDEDEIGLRLDEIYSQLSFLENDFDKKVKSRITVDNVGKKEKNFREILENVEKVVISETIFHKQNIPDKERFLSEMHQKQVWKEQLIKKVEAKIREIEDFRKQALQDEQIRQKEEKALAEAKALIDKEDFKAAENILENQIKFSLGQQKELLDTINNLKIKKKEKEEAEEKRRQEEAKRQQELEQQKKEEEQRQLKLKQQQEEEEEEKKRQKAKQEEEEAQRKILLQQQQQQQQQEEEEEEEKEEEEKKKEQERKEKEEQENLLKQEQQKKQQDEEMKQKKQQEEELAQQQRLEQIEQEEEEKRKKEEVVQQHQEEEEKKLKQEEQKIEEEEQKQQQQKQQQQLTQSTEQPQNKAIIDTTQPSTRDQITEKEEDQKSKKDQENVVNYTWYAVIGVSLLAASLAGLKYLRK